MMNALGARCPHCARPSGGDTSGPRRRILHYGRRLPWVALVDEDLRRGVFVEHAKCRDKAVRRLAQVAADLAAAAGVFSARVLLAEALKKVGG